MQSVYSSPVIADKYNKFKDSPFSPWHEIWTKRPAIKPSSSDAISSKGPYGSFLSRSDAFRNYKKKFIKFVWGELKRRAPVEVMNTFFFFNV
jgi:hypothetical protein